MRDINMLVVHCSDTDNGDAESIRKYHMEHNGWLDIGYHYVILRSGKIESGRPPDQVGAHVQGHNENSLGVCLIGKDTFTLPQFLSLGGLYRSLNGIYGIGLNETYCHYELDTHGKTCPNIMKDDLIKFLKLH